MPAIRAQLVAAALASSLLLVWLGSANAAEAQSDVPTPADAPVASVDGPTSVNPSGACLLYTSDAADDN